jgi:two-component system sensor histidine kinase UhpB
LVLAFTFECIIMLVLATMAAEPRHPLVDAFGDSFMLTLMLAPALWFLIVRPLQRLSASRGQLLAQLFDATEQERGRLARDLHDELGGHLTAILIGLRNVDMAENVEQAKERARVVAEAGAASLDKVRRIARALRPTVLEDLGLTPAIERLCDEYKGKLVTDTHGLSIDLMIDLDPAQRFSPQVEMCVFRVLQEALTNCARHAGATAVTVHIAGGEGSVQLTVTDNGCGFVPAKLSGGSFGLSGMRQRVELLDGLCEIHSAKGVGTTVHVRLPIHPVPQNAAAASAKNMEITQS